MTIPKRLVRTVPLKTSDEVEQFWQTAKDLHPDWEHVDLREPVSRDDFPIASHLWDSADSGSQKSDLIRAEELYHRGGVYIDSDVECYRPFDSLLGLDGFAAYEDEDHICTAVIGFAPGHPAVHELLLEGIERHDQGAWAAAIGVASEIWPGRNDMALLPPGSFFPFHYKVKWEDQVPPRWVVRKTNPWAYAAHHWEGSWLPK